MRLALRWSSRIRIFTIVAAMARHGSRPLRGRAPRARTPPILHLARHEPRNNVLTFRGGLPCCDVASCQSPGPDPAPRRAPRGNLVDSPTPEKRLHATWIELLVPRE